jgi:hypothetical protein
LVFAKRAARLNEWRFSQNASAGGTGKNFADTARRITGFQPVA